MLHNWISTIVFTAFVCFVMLTLTPQGRIRRVGELICGLVMIAALLSLAKSLDMSSYAEALAGYRHKAEELSRSGEEYSENLNRTIIEEKLGAYILDKAEKLGAAVSEVIVTAQWSRNGYWVPDSAEIRGDCTGEEKRLLGQWMETELGITEEKVTWNG